MNSLFFSSTLILGTVALTALSGLAIDDVLYRSKDRARIDWKSALLMGVCILTVAGHFLVHAGLRVPVFAPSLMILVITASLVVVWKSSNKQTIPLAVIVSACVVYMVHGLGIWIVGTDAYLARGWGDQSNYISIAHYLTNYHFGELPPVTDPAALVGHAYVLPRDGQSVFVGLLANILGTDPKYLFEPVILLVPLLIYATLLQISDDAGLEKRTGQLAALFGACMPAVASIHLEGFLSQALATPLLLALPLYVGQAMRSGSVTPYLRVGLLISTGIVVYPEYSVLYALAIGGPLLFGLVDSSTRRNCLVGTVVIALIPILLLLENTKLLTIYQNAGDGAFNSIFPWANSIEALVRIWLGDFVRVAPPTAAIAYSVGLATLGLIGLCLLWTRRRALGTGFLLICIFPVALLLAHPGASYAVYKIASSVSPLYAWGIVFLCARLPVKFAVRTSAIVASLGAMTLSMAAILDMVWATTKTNLSNEQLTYRRQVTNVVLNKDFLRVEHYLHNLRGANIITCINDQSPNGSYTNLWLAIAGRRNNIWAMNPQLNDTNMSRLMGSDYLNKAGIPNLNSVFVVSTSNRATLWPSKSLEDDRSILMPFSYRVLEPHYSPLVLACVPALMNVSDTKGSITVPPSGSSFVFYSSIVASVSLNFSPDLSVKKANLQFSQDGSPISHATDSAGTANLVMQVKPGFTTLQVNPGENMITLHNVRYIAAAR